MVLGVPDGELTRVVLIRHGESASNAGKWVSGQATCGGLTELGVRQAAAASERLAADSSLAPDAVLVSTMRRAVETAEIVSAPWGIAPEQRAELMERTAGEAEGMTVDQYVETYGRAPWSDWSEPMSPGGESGAEFVVRVNAALDRVVTEFRGRTVWVVCHGGVIMVTATQRWPHPSGDLAELGVLNPANTSISEWLVSESGWTMCRYNDHSHLIGLDGAGLGAPASI